MLRILAALSMRVRIYERGDVRGWTQDVVKDASRCTNLLNCEAAMEIVMSAKTLQLRISGFPPPLACTRIGELPKTPGREVLQDMRARKEQAPMGKGRQLT